MRIIGQFFGYIESPNELQQLYKRMIVVSLLIISMYHLSSTFLVLYVAEKLNISTLATLLSFALLIETLCDYPSGVLGDWFGQRWVLCIAYLFLAVFYFSLPFATSLEFFFVIYCIEAIGLSQESGALQSWFDSNYKNMAVTSDTDRQIYGFFTGRLNTATQIVSSLIFIVGGLIATFGSREFVFLIQGIGHILLAFIVLSLKNYTAVANPNKQTKSQNLLLKTNNSIQKSKRVLYIKFFSSGIKFVFSNKYVLFFIIGTVLVATIQYIWVKYLLFFIIFGYTGTDALAGMLRTAIYIITTIVGIQTAKFSKKIVNKSQIALVTALWGIFFYGSYGFLVLLDPLTNSLHPISVGIILFVIMPISSFCVSLFFILKQRTLTDLIPSEIRTSVYSLTSTLRNCLVLGLLLGIGYSFTQWGFSIVLIILAILMQLAALIILIGIKSTNTVNNSNNMTKLA